jgi:hypothetical protein
MTYAAPTVVAGTAGKATTGSVSIARPTSLRVGDLLVLVVATEAAASGIEVPLGFLPIVGEMTQGAAVNLRAWYKFATHAESATYLVSFEAADDSIYNLFLVRGVSPFGVVNVLDSAQGSAGLPIVEPGVTTTVDNCLAIAVIAYDGSPRVLVQPTGWTLLKSEDGPAGSICAGIAYKTIATAGASGGGNWTATDSSADDYIALTFAVTPGVMSRGESVLYLPQQLLAWTLADCTEFRNLVGAADRAAALARIWHEALPPPAGGADHYSLAEAIAYRPFALIFTNDLDGEMSTRQATPATWADQGTLRVLLEMPTPADLDESPVLLDQLVKQIIGRVMQRPPDETAGQFYGLRDLAHATNETGGYSYLAADQVSFRGYHRSSLRDQPGQGDFLFAWLEVQYGQRSA